MALKIYKRYTTGGTIAFVRTNPITRIFLDGRISGGDKMLSKVSEWNHVRSCHHIPHGCTHVISRHSDMVVRERQAQRRKKKQPFSRQFSVFGFLINIQSK